MFPIRLSSIFRNRWMALIWAAGIIWFAYDVAGSSGADDNGSANADQQATQATQALNAF